MPFASPTGQILTGHPGSRMHGKNSPAPRRQRDMNSSKSRLSGHGLYDGPPVDVTSWRRSRLLEAGFPEDLATVLAGTSAVDLHALLELVDRGCPPHLAARILAPLDGERSW